MNKGEAKKQKILDSGLQVMMSNGYNGTSVKDIVDAAQVPKGSFYNYFESKEAFALEAIEKVASENYLQSSALLRSSNGPAKDRLLKYFEMSVSGCCENNFKIGCFLGNMCQEMADNSEAIRAKIEQALSDMTGLISSVLNQAQKTGDIDTNYDTDMLAEFLFNSWQGAILRMKASCSRAPLDAFSLQLERLFKK